MLWDLAQHASWLPTDDRLRKEGFVALKYFLHFWSLEFIQLISELIFGVFNFFKKTAQKFDEILP
jgi:hypothetical protein